jgi:hypothetical protein
VSPEAEFLGAQGEGEMAKLEVYKDAGGSYRWRLIASNGQNIASSGESFSSKQAAIGGCDAVKRAAPDAEIIEKD